MVESIAWEQHLSRGNRPIISPQPPTVVDSNSDKCLKNLVQKVYEICLKQENIQKDINYVETSIESLDRRIDGIEKELNTQHQMLDQLIILNLKLLKKYELITPATVEPLTPKRRSPSHPIIKK